MSNFVHLHVHSQYSILDGASNLLKLVERVKKLEMNAIAITDHGNLFGAKEFHNIAKKEGIKPILGCEMYVARRTRFDKDKDVREDKSGNHLIVLAKNIEGYKNLIKLVSLSWIEGFYSKPRIDKELLFANKEGLIVSTACIAGEVPRAILAGDKERAEKVVTEFKEQFGEDFYLEVMRHATNDPTADTTVYAQQQRANATIFEIAEKLNVKVIATNDVHFINETDAEAHDRLICINTNASVSDPARMRYTKQEFLKSPQEMATLFADHPEVLSNTLEIAEKVEIYNLNSNPIMPAFELPEGFDNDDEYLKYITYKGAEERYPEITPEIKERIDFELETVKRMGFPSYFLIVWDIIKSAREIGIWVGPGRGSAAGSVIAYCLKITNLDPLPYGLLFERFLNPDRISMPDIDIDFDEDGREKILAWVEKKYGHERVANIITFGTMAAKSAIKDVARVQDVRLSEADRLSKMIPAGITSLTIAYDQIPELKKERDSGSPECQSTLKYAEILEGSVRQTGIHACGVIIGKESLINYLPLSTSKESHLLVSQYEGNHLEDIGLLKMDFLGLKTLSINKDALELIKKRHNVDIDLDKLPLTDKLTFQLYSKGNTTAVFQFESPGMKKYLKELKPSRFEDLIAMNALYRPGPIEYIPLFINRKHGRDEIKYDLIEMEAILKETYGVTVYQEQVMLLSQTLGGFSKGDADTLRKAMGKKQRETLDKMKSKFIDGCKQKGFDEKICDKIWTDWEKFAQYAFNKSHSTCYAFLSYQNAYLKAHYPAEFMAANLSRNLNDIKEITKLMESCREMGLTVLGPSVNESDIKFTVVRDDTIRFGMSAIKNVGEMAAQSIIDEREKNGPFLSLYDFVERVNLTSVNKRTIEALVLSGGFDCFPEVKRYSFFSEDKNEPFFIDTLIKYGSKMTQDKDKQQLSLFGEAIQVEVSKPEIPQRSPWSDIYQLNKEKELIGLYISAHPLDAFRFEIENLCNYSLTDLKDLTPMKGKDVIVAGFVTKTDNFTDKNGNPFGRFVVEDFTGSYTFTLFNKNFINYSKYFHNGLCLWITGDVQPRMYSKSETEELEFRIKTINLIADVKPDLVKKITLYVPITEISEVFISNLEDVCSKSKGKTQLNFKIIEPEKKVILDVFSRKYLVTVSNELIEFIEENENITFKLN